MLAEKFAMRQKLKAIVLLLLFSWLILGRDYFHTHRLAISAPVKSALQYSQPMVSGAATGSTLCAACLLANNYTPPPVIQILPTARSYASVLVAAPEEPHSSAHASLPANRAPPF